MSQILNKNLNFSIYANTYFTYFTFHTYLIKTMKQCIKYLISYISAVYGLPFTAYHPAGDRPKDGDLPFTIYDSYYLPLLNSITSHIPLLIPGVFFVVTKLLAFQISQDPARFL